MDPRKIMKTPDSFSSHNSLYTGMYVCMYVCTVCMYVFMICLNAKHEVYTKELSKSILLLLHNDTCEYTSYLATVLR